MSHKLSILIFIFTLAQTAISEIDFIPLTQDKLKVITQLFDNKYHFIVLESLVMEELRSMLPVGSNIFYYTHNCKENRDLVKACDHAHHTAILLIYNKVMMEYQIHIETHKKSQLLSDITQWTYNMINGQAKIDLTNYQILQLLREKKEVFVLVENKTVQDLGIAYQNLAKQFWFKSFVYLQDLELVEQYNLSIGNLIHIKNLYQQTQQFPKDIVTLIHNSTCTTYFPYEMKRYQKMKVFVIQNTLTRGINKNMQNIDRYRFNLQKKQQNNNPLKIIYIICDMEIICINYIQKIDQQLFAMSNKLSNMLFRKIFYRFDSLKVIQLLQVYYHIKLHQLKLPYILVLNGQDPNIPYLPLRYSKQLNIQREQPLEEIIQFIQQIDQNKIPNTQLISQIPKKNGFYGKGSQKNIQKLNYQTYQNVLNSAKQANIFYFLFITAFQFDCSQCVTFYNQFKKLAAFLHAGSQLNVVFGVFDLSKDQIDFKHLKDIPIILLFSPYSQQPIRYNNRFDFESIHRFLKTQINKQIERKQNEDKNKEGDEL